MGQFVNFLKENKLDEGIFDFLKKKKSEAEPSFYDRNMHTDQSLLNMKLIKAERELSKKDAEEKLIGYGLGNLGQALEIYGTLFDKHYSPFLINKLKKSPIYNKKWQEYRNLFISALKAKQKNTLKMIIEKAFKEMNIPEPDGLNNSEPEIETEPEKELIKKTNDKYLQDVVKEVSEELKVNPNLNSDTIRDFILNKFPDFKKRYPKTWQLEIGRVRKMVTKPKLLKLTKADLKPEKEEKEDKNILSFQNYINKRNIGRV